MISYVADENFNGHVIDALRRRWPRGDVVTVQELGLERTTDPDLLEWAARNQRLVLTHDVRTLVNYAWQRVAAGKRMPGVVEVVRRLRIGKVVEDLIILAECSDSDDWEGQVIYLPL